MMAVEITEEFVWQSIPPRARDSHKGTFGSVLAVAGSAFYRGAALLDAAEIDTTGYSARDKRVHGFLAERLLDVWLAQQDYRVKELPVAHLERQHWGRKIVAFLLRKMGIKNDRTAR